MEGTLTEVVQHDQICPYEVERNSRKKALHDAVERDLVAAGFKDAATLRGAFSGEASSAPGEDSRPKNKKQRRKKSDLNNGEVTLRRTTRRTGLVPQEEPRGHTQNAGKRKNFEDFRSWPGKDCSKKQKAAMKKMTGSSKRQMSVSPDPATDADVEEEGRQSPSVEQHQMYAPSTTPERAPTVFEDDPAEVPGSRRERGTSGPPRPPRAGYRMECNDKRDFVDWGQEYSSRYGHSAEGSYRPSSRRPWSPPYGVTREYDRFNSEYGGQGHPRYSDHRDPYFDRRGRDFDRRTREYEEGQRYEEGRYERRAPTPDLYGSTGGPSGGSQYPRNLSLGTSAAPSSSAIIENEVKAIDKAKRPLPVDKYGVPTGAMATLFNADINAFVKDMDPRVGWDGQSKEAKHRLLERLHNEYDILGESSRLSEKYVRKQAGAGLTQYRFSLNQLIDKDNSRPSDLNKTVWDDMVEKRKSKEGKEMSERMANIARGRGSKGTTKKAVRESVIVFLTRHLKRDPYQSEIEEAFQKEWNLVQEEQTDRKKVKAAATAITSTSVVSDNIMQRLDVLDSFMQKWGPQLEEWMKQQANPAKQGPPLKRSVTNSVDTNKLALVVANESDDHTKTVEEEQCTDSSDESDGTSNAKKTDDEEIDSDSEKEVSNEETRTPTTVSVVKVVETHEEAVGIDSTRKSSASGELSIGKGKSVTYMSEASAAAGHKVVAEAPTVQKKAKAAGVTKQLPRMSESPIESSLEKKDGSMAVLKEKESAPRSSKRQKVEGNSAADPVVVEEDKEVQPSTKGVEVTKNSKGTRKNVKSADGKVVKAGKKLK